MKRTATLILTFFAVSLAAHAQITIDVEGHGHATADTMLDLQSGISTLNTMGLAHYDCGSMFNDLTCHQEALKMLYFSPAYAWRIVNMVERGHKHTTAPAQSTAPTCTGTWHKYVAGETPDACTYY